MFVKGYGKEKNANKEFFLPIKNCLVYNIIQINQIYFLLKPNLDYIWTMSFSSQKFIYYLINIRLPIIYIKTQVVLKRLQFNNNESEEILL